MTDTKSFKLRNYLYYLRSSLKSNSISRLPLNSRPLYKRITIINKINAKNKLKCCSCRLRFYTLPHRLATDKFPKKTSYSSFFNQFSCCAFTAKSFALSISNEFESEGVLDLISSSNSCKIRTSLGVKFETVGSAFGRGR